MVPDSLKMVNDTTYIILQHLKEINSNTDGFSNLWSSLISIISIFASLVTIFGIISLRGEMRKKRANYEFRKRIILDLIRHMMVNNSILEVIRYKREIDKNFKPTEGILQRFATLESDIELGRFSMSADNYELIHNLSLKIRNYNSVVKNADKHIHNQDTPFDTISKELDDIFYRGVEISIKLLDIGDDKLYWRINWSKKLTRFSIRIAEKFNWFKALTQEDVKHYIADNKYNQKWVQDRISENRYDIDYPIPCRNFPDKPYYRYYDDLGLGDTFNHLIRHNGARF